LTDVEGRYFCSVPPGVYRVRTELSRLDTFYLPEIYGTKAPGDEGLGIRVRAGVRLDVPFVLKRSGTISGRVVDSDAVPLREALVTVFREPTDPPTLGVRPMETAVSVGDSGGFTISGLVPGSYRIRAEPPEYRTASDKDGRRLVPTWYPATTEPRRSIPVQINGDELGGVDLVVTRSRMPVVSGRVVRADGQPASGIQVHLVTAVGATYSISSSPVTTGAKGEFAFQSIAAGAYQVVVAVPGDPPETLNAPLVIGDADVEDLLLSLRVSSAVRGRILFEGGDYAGGSLSVDARTLDAYAVGSRATVDAAWSFVLPQPTGARLLRVSGLAKGWWLKSVTAANRDITNEPVDLADKFDVGILVSRRMSTLAGNVSADPDTGELPADTAVLIFSEDASQWIAGSTAIARVWPTPMSRDDGREEGRFVAEGLPAGASHVIAVARTPAGFLQATPHVLRSLTVRATRLTLGDAETRQVRLSLVRQE
jgi:hypothetical protein